MRRFRNSALLALTLLTVACQGDHGHDLTGAGDSCCTEEPPEAAPTSGVPDTSLYLLDAAFQDQDGTGFQLENLRGRPVVVAMIFTHCAYACPRILADLKAIEAELSERRRAGSRFLLISMDTARDTPEVLASYAETHGLDLDRWTLLHGSDFAVRGVAGALGVRYKRDGNGDFAHSNLITVLDGDGRIAHQLEGLNADTSLSVQALDGLLP